MKKHSGILLVICVLVVITLATIAAGFGYAAARSSRSANVCTCDERIVETAKIMDISHYYASMVVQGRLRKAGLYEEASQIKVCKCCLEFEMSK